MRVDAKAEGETIGIGGWAPHTERDGTISKQKSKWFAVTLDRTNAPWAFYKGEPYRSISALELLGSTIGLVAFSQLDAPTTGRKYLVGVTGVTDSQVSSAVVARGLSTSFPLCVVAMEMAAQQERLGIHLDLAWTPRETNAEADALSNLDFEGFSENLRIKVDLGRVNWLVLGRFMSLGTKYYEDVQALKAANKRKQGAVQVEKAKGRRITLKERDPW